MFSLKCKTGRLTGEWKVVKAAGEIPDIDVDLILEFEKDGDFSATSEYVGYSYSYNGEWEWEDNKEVIEITLEDETLEWEVKRLTNSELWFEDEEDEMWELEKL